MESTGLLMKNNKPQKEERYFNFPLCLLTMSIDPEELYMNIVTYCTLRNSSAFTAKLMESEDQWEMLMEYEEFSVRYTIDSGYHEMMEEYDLYPDAIAFMARRFGYDDDTIYRILDKGPEVLDYYSDFTYTFGEDALVRVRKDYIDDMRNGKIDMNMFRTYCGIVSYIGDKKFMQVSNSIIIPRTSGLKSTSTMQLCEKNGFFFPDVLTARQINNAIDNLEERGFILFMTIDNNKRYFTIAMSSKELGMEIEKKLHEREQRIRKRLQAKYEEEERLNNLSARLKAGRIGGAQN